MTRRGGDGQLSWRDGDGIPPRGSAFSFLEPWSSWLEEEVPAVAILENSLMRGDGEALFSRNGAEEKEGLLQLVHEGFHRSAGSRGANLPRGNFCAVKMLPSGMISSFASISERFALSPRL